MPSRNNYIQMEKGELIQWLEEAHSRLDKKNDQLRTTRKKLNAAREKVSKLKSTVAYQRSRIIELTPQQRGSLDRRR